MDNLPDDHRLWKQEMFLPIVTVVPFVDMDEAMRLAINVEYGLTAGFFSEDDAEVQWWLDNIEAGVLYVNRSRRGDNRRVAGLPIYWRLEGQRLHR